MCFNPSLSIHNKCAVCQFGSEESSFVSIFHSPGWFSIPGNYGTLQPQVLTAFNKEMEAVPEPRVVVETRGGSDPAADTFGAEFVATRPCD